MMDRRRFLGLALTAGVALPLASCGGGADCESCPHAPARHHQALDGELFARRARHHFADAELTCGEAIVLAGCEALDEPTQTAGALALGLAGGIGLRGDACGVLTGGGQVIALAVGRGIKDYKQRKRRVMAAVGRFYDDFAAAHDGTVDCRAICGCDLTTAAGRTALKRPENKRRCIAALERGCDLVGAVCRG
ncbi:MAG: C-GCAxxG-C-C family (seleno)protein [Planctomycetota bacterium]